MVKVSIEEMTRAEYKEIMDKIEVAIVPTGSTEQHGPHLPMRHDAASALYLAKRAAERLYPKVVVTPPIAIGISFHHMNWPGSLTLTAETFMNMIFDMCKSLRHHGIDRVLILNGHGGNRSAIRLVGFRIRDELRMKVAAVSYWELLKPDFVKEIVEENIYPGHAGEFETSVAYIIHPELMRDDLIPEAGEMLPYLRFMIMDEEETSPGGVWHNPRLGSPEKGRKILDALVDELEIYLKKFMEIS